MGNRHLGKKEKNKMNCPNYDDGIELCWYLYFSFSMFIKKSSLSHISRKIFYSIGSWYLIIIICWNLTPILISKSVILQELAKEPPIEELGLGGWTPSGMVQQCLEYLHIGLDMPWWQAIIAGNMF